MRVNARGDAVQPVGSTDLTVAQVTDTSTPPESAVLLQSRLAVFVGVLATTAFTLYVVGFVAALVSANEVLLVAHTHPAKVVHAAISIGLGGAWIALKRWTLPLDTLRLTDPVLTVLMVVPTALAMGQVPIGYVGVFSALLAMMFTLTARAALVPSPPSRTALIGLVCSASVVFVAHRAAQRNLALPEAVPPVLFAVAAAVWCATIVVVTSLTSRVIYGLHRDVRRAHKLGQYTLGAKLGEGGMGAVYLAEHAMLRRPTAVKLLLPSRTGGTSLQRFEREVQLTAMLTHPNTIAIYDYGRTTDGLFYYAMEFVDGLTLEELVASEGAQPAARAIHVLAQVAGALGEAHRAGLIHRDVKPSNILLCERGGVPDTVKVVDFGLVKQLDAPADMAVTQANTITGTPAYLAPEMITRPASVDARADIYGVGCVLYFMLTGTPVFEGDSVVEICGKHLHQAPEPPSQRSGKPIPEELEALVLRCLEKRPSDRPATAQLVEEALAELATKHPWKIADARTWWSHWRAEHPSLLPRPVEPDPTVPN